MPDIRHRNFQGKTRGYIDPQPAQPLFDGGAKRSVGAANLDTGTCHGGGERNGLNATRARSGYDLARVGVATVSD